MDMTNGMGDLKKNFFDKPEGKLGMVVLAVLIVGGGFLLYQALPYILTLFENLLYAILMGLAICAIVFLMFDRKFRTVLWAFYKIIMKAVTGFAIELDPIAITKGYIDDLKSNRIKMNSQIAKLKGQIVNLKRIMDSNLSTMKNSMKEAKVFNDKGNKSMVSLKSRKAGRLKESNMRLDTLYVKMEKLYNILKKMFEVSGYVIEDLVDEVEVAEQERNAITQGYSAFKSAMSIVNGDPDKKAMFDAAMEHMQMDVANKIGEMDRFMEMSTSFIENMDVANGIYEEEGLEMLEKFENDGFAFLTESFSKLPSGKDANEKTSFDLNENLGNDSFLSAPTGDNSGQASGNAKKYF